MPHFAEARSYPREAVTYLALEIEKEESGGHREVALAAKPVLVVVKEKEAAVAVSPGDLARKLLTAEVDWLCRLCRLSSVGRAAESRDAASRGR